MRAVLIGAAAIGGLLLRRARPRLPWSSSARRRFETVLSEVSAVLARGEAGHLDRALERGLGEVAAFLGADRGTVTASPERETGVRAAWAAPGLARPDGTGEDGQYPWTADALRRRHTVRVHRLDELPPEAAVDRASHERAGTRSHLAMPLVAGGRVFGALAFDAVRRERAWPDDVVERLRLLSQPFAGALARQQAEGEARALRQDLAHVGRVSVLGELTASLAHELNQPLTAILANAQAAQRLLAAEVVNLDEIREILDDIVADDKRAGGVIRRLRSLLRKGDPEFCALDLSELVAEVAGLVRNDAVTRHVTMRLELAADLPAVRGDRAQLQQVVLNLVLNGLEAMQPPHAGDRTLVIRTTRDGPAAVAVAVVDTGVGLDGADVARLFQPLHTTKAEGLGMGLAIARTIVEAHGGRLEATGSAGGGATFRFTLPAAGGDPR